jgi:1-aminocyclopropane-1-carboxylate deaminase/D-cysteine desulfhydrase-like pyridoxal-dependent ACC family enzyme
LVASEFGQHIRPTPITELHAAFLDGVGVKLSIKREDLNHPFLSGNKAHKLKYNLLEAERLGHHKLLTFGGAYSNHIRATAAAGHLFGFETIGIIRGEEHLPLNSTLSKAKEMDMELHYLDRTTYRQKHAPEVMEKLQGRHGDAYIIPEGGTNKLALKGCREWGEGLPTHHDWVVTPVGTGGSMAGLALGLAQDTKLLGIPVLKGANFLNREIAELIGERDVCQWELSLDYHFGGYAKSSDELLAFIASFTAHHHIPLEFVYTGKMMFGIFDLIKKGFFQRGAEILAIHTGGLR